MFSLFVFATTLTCSFAEKETSLGNLPMDGSAQYNPEWTPDGNEGGVDTNGLPWIDLPQLEGASFKPLRASRETGAFTIIIKVPKGFQFPKTVYFGASDVFILSGNMTYNNGPAAGSLGPGYWGYTPANAVVEGCVAVEETEFLTTYYAPAAFLNSEGKIAGLLTSADVRRMALEKEVHLLPNTLHEALAQKKPKYDGPKESLQCATDGSAEKMNKMLENFATELTNPYWVDTNSLPWIVDPDAPDIGLKVMRVSTETGFVSLIVRQNGQAPPHYHLGAADFFITSGAIGYRAGPPEGYGPGTYMWEPAGARHESTQRVTDEDLIYTANLYGPIQFDSGVGTPPLMVMSWMQYMAAAQGFKSPLLHSTFPDDHGTMLVSNSIV